MERLRPRDLRALFECLREWYAPRDVETLRAFTITALPTVVRSESTTYCEFDLRQRRMTIGVVEPVDPGALRDAPSVFAQHMTEYPLIMHYHRTQDGGARKTSDFLTQRQFHRLGLYQEFLRGLRVEDEMVIRLPAPSPLVRGFGLHRSRRDFTERDRLLLNLLRPHLAQAYQSAEALTQMQAHQALLRQVVEDEARGVIILSRQGRITLMTPQAERWVAEWFGRPSADRLPEALQRWVRHQEALLDRADDAPPPREPLVVERDGTRLVVRHLDDADRCLLLFEEQPTAPQPAALDACGLTRREAEVLHWAGQGKSNADVATILGMSPYTVKKHLEHIHDKLGVETRTAAAALAFDLAQRRR